MLKQTVFLVLSRVFISSLRYIQIQAECSCLEVHGFRKLTHGYVYTYSSLEKLSLLSHRYLYKHTHPQTPSFSRKELKTLLLIPEAYPCKLVLAGPLHLHKASFLYPPTSRSACLHPIKQVRDSLVQKGTQQTRLVSSACKETPLLKQYSFTGLKYSKWQWRKPVIQTSEPRFCRMVREALLSLIGRWSSREFHSFGNDFVRKHMHHLTFLCVILT